MADPYGLELSGLPPELAAQAKGLQRKQAMQEAMLKQSQTPLGGARSAGRYMVAPSPLEGVAKLVQAYMASKGLADTDKGFADIGSRAQQMTAEEVQKYRQMKAGTPTVPAEVMPEDVSGPARPEQPGVAGDPRAAVQMAMASRNPVLHRLGTMDNATLNRNEDREDQQKFRREDREMQLKAQRDNLEYQVREGRITREEADRRAGELRRELTAQADATRRELAANAARDRENNLRIAASLRQEPAPTVAEVLKDGKVVKVDARTGRVIGDAPSEAGKPPSGYRKTAEGNLEAIPGGPADIKIQSKNATTEGGRKGVSDLVTQLGSYYDDLEKSGGITSTEAGPIDNVTAGVASSGLGQAVGKMFGTQNQSARNSIAQTRPLLLNAIKNATGMSAKQMDSNAEMKLYLQAATDPTLDVRANRNALQMLEKLYGLGGADGVASPAKPGAKPAAPAPSAQDQQALDWATANPNDPRAAAIRQRLGR